MENDLVFLSYSHRDEQVASRLFRELRAAGVNVWFDKEHLLPGQHWREVIPSVIKSSRYFIALLSSKSVSQRGYVNEELANALSVIDEFPRDQIFLIPVRLDECSPSHGRLRDLHWVDLFPSWQRGLEKILAALEIHDMRQRSRTGILVDLKIDYPHNGERVGHKVGMGGIVVNVPSEFEIWAVTIPSGGAFHPQHGPAIIEETRWYLTAYVGNKRLGADRGARFTIRLVLATQELGTRFREYIRTARMTNSWTGLPSLGGEETLAEVWVVRDDEAWCNGR